MKSGALTEVTRSIFCFHSIHLSTGYAVMQFIEEKTGGRLSLRCRHFIWCIKFQCRKRDGLSYSEIVKVEKEYLITVKGEEMAEKELIRLRELVGLLQAEL
ncbi:MAG: PadR family transcriptional regulator [Blautia faecis]